MKYLITGGCGFIGSNLISHLFKTYPNCEIINVDKLTYCGNPDNLSWLTSSDYNYIFYKMDIIDNDISKIIKDHKPDVVISLAAQTHVDRSIRNPKEFIETDTLGTFNLVYWCMKEKVKRFIFCSTDEVFGPITKGEANFRYPLRPTSPYSASKAAGDLLVQSYIKTYKFPAIIVRPSNNYGPYQYPEKLIPCIITRLLDNKKVLLHGTGKEIREWVYVADCCRAIDFITNKGNIGWIYNIGSTVRLNNVTVIKDIISTMYGSRVNFQDFIDRVPNRPGNDYRYAINSKDTLSLGNYISLSWKQGLQATVDWYRKNTKWLNNLDIDISANIYNDEYLR